MQITDPSKYFYSVFALILIVLINISVIEIYHQNITPCSNQVEQKNTLVREAKSPEIKKAEQFLPKFSNPKKYFIYLCDCTLGCGGYSDRQKGIIATYLISMLSNRTFGIRHTCPRVLEEMLIPNKIQWIVHPHALEGLTTRHHNAVEDLKLAHDLSNIDFEEYYKEDVIYFTINKETIDQLRRHRYVGLQIPWLGKMTTSEVYATLLTLMFKPSVQLGELLTIFYKKLQGKPLICAHLRLGGNPSIPEDVWTNEADIKRKFYKSDIGKVWAKLYANLDFKNFKLFVASDSEEIKQLAQQEFNGHIVDTPGIITHVDRSTNRFAYGGFLKAVMDNIILSSCDVLVLTLSGFGIHAAYSRVTSDNLFCVYKHEIIPCTRDTANLIYQWL